MSDQRRKREGVVYSTRPDYEYHVAGEVTEAAAPARQRLRVSLDKRQRAGKKVTLVSGFAGPDESLKDLCRQLQQACGVGGSAKAGEVVLQGDVRDKVCELLRALGHDAKRS